MKRIPSEVKTFDARFPLASFDPRYRKVFEAALRQSVTITFASEKEAKAFQLRLQMFRKKLIELNDPSAQSYYRIKTSRHNNKLTLRPADEPFDEILAAFDADLRNTDVVSPAEPEADTQSETVEFDDLFRDIQEGDSDESA